MTGPFSVTAHLYDATYAHLDYGAHASTIEEVIRTRNPKASTLLDVSCGTGKHLEIWQDRFEHVEGIDVDANMLSVARERVPDVPLHEADFTDFDLGRTFDAVTCLGSSIGYAHTEERLDAAVAAMARHLAPGGVVAVEPWLMPHMLEPPQLRAHVVERDDIVVVRTSNLEYDGDADGGISDMEMSYLFTTRDGTEFHQERHVMGVRPPERYLLAAERAGLDAEFEMNGPKHARGLLIGVRP